VASVQVYRYEFLQNNPYGGFVTGDVLDIYVETDDIIVPTNLYLGAFTGVSVELNGSPLASSAYFILNYTPSLISIQEFNPQICVGTSLAQFSKTSFFPFASYYSFENHYSCAVNPPTCNLIVAGVPSVVPATTATATDGAITVNGSSSLSIQYKLGSDFVYNDGTAQSSGTFSGLLTGSYRIFLRDSANCGVNVLVNVPVDNSYGPKYRLEYEDLNGWSTRLDIVKRGYSGSVTEITGDTNSSFEVSLRGEGERDKFVALLSIDAIVQLVSITDAQFLEIYTNDPQLFRINYYKDFGSGLELQLVSKILPNQGTEEFISTPYGISFVSSCSLPELKDYILVQDDGQKFVGTISLIKLIAHCLRFLKLELPIRVGCNLYAVDMDQTNADDPFDQAYIDFEAFYLAEEEPTLEFVLQSILEPFNARLIQWEGRWNIVRVEEMVADYDYRDFDKDGEYTGNGTYSPVKTIDLPSIASDAKFCNLDQQLELRPGYGKLKVKYNLGLKPNILDNGDFRLNATYSSAFSTYFYSINKDGWTLVNAGYVLNESYDIIDPTNVAYKIESQEDTLTNPNGGNAYIQSDTYTVKMGANNQLKFTLRCKVARTRAQFGSQIYTIEVPYVKVRARVKYGSLYLQSDGSWSSTENILAFFLTEWDKYTEFEIIGVQPVSGTPVTGMDFDVRVYHAYAYFAEFQSLAALKALPTYSGGSQLIHTGYKTELRPAAGYLYFHELEETTAPENLSDYSIVRQTDYNAGTNPRQWVLKFKTSIGGVSGTNIFPFFIDKVAVQFLTDNKDPIDAIVRSTLAESGNKLTFEKELIIGSYSNLIVTETILGLSIGLYTFNTSLNIITRNILSSDLIYTGYLRDVDGNGYEMWARDGVAEEDKLHGIFLKQYAKQYRRSWATMRGSFASESTYVGFLNSIQVVQNDNKIFIPIGLTLRDRDCEYSGEMLELIDDSGTSDGGGSAPYSSGFSIGFGASGFN
jgi:hypothetical protein